MRLFFCLSCLFCAAVLLWQVSAVSTYREFLLGMICTYLFLIAAFVAAFWEPQKKEEVDG